MDEQRVRAALSGLQWTVGIVILIESILFIMPSAAHEFASTHMPNMVREALGWGEIVAAILFLIPRTVVRGGWLLIGIFAAAILIHLLHGMFNVGSLAIYTAAALAVVMGKAA
jgi:hypothetical protein